MDIQEILEELEAIHDQAYEVYSRLDDMPDLEDLAYELQCIASRLEESREPYSEAEEVQGRIQDLRDQIEEAVREGKFGSNSTPVIEDRLDDGTKIVIPIRPAGEESEVIGRSHPEQEVILARLRGA